VQQFFAHLIESLLLLKCLQYGFLKTYLDVVKYQMLLKVFSLSCDYYLSALMLLPV